MTQPEAKQRLEAHLGLAYIDEHWAQILKAVMSCEEDSTQAIKVVELLASQALASPTITLSLPTVLLSPDQQSIKTQLMECVTKLVKRKHIFSTPPTLDELVDPAEEIVIPLAVALPGDEEEIIALVRQEADIRSGKIPMEIDNESKDDGDVVGSGEDMSGAELLELCAKLEGACIGASAFDAMNLVKELHIFQGELRQEETMNAKQITLEDAWKITM